MHNNFIVYNLCFENSASAYAQRELAFGHNLTPTTFYVPTNHVKTNITYFSVSTSTTSTYIFIVYQLIRLANLRRKSSIPSRLLWFHNISFYSSNFRISQQPQLVERPKIISFAFEKPSLSGMSSNSSSQLHTSPPDFDAFSTKGSFWHPRFWQPNFPHRLFSC